MARRKTTETRDGQTKAEVASCENHSKASIDVLAPQILLSDELVVTQPDEYYRIELWARGGGRKAVWTDFGWSGRADDIESGEWSLKHYELVAKIKPLLRTFTLRTSPSIDMEYRFSFTGTLRYPIPVFVDADNWTDFVNAKLHEIVEKEIMFLDSGTDVNLDQYANDCKVDIDDARVHWHNTVKEVTAEGDWTFERIGT